MAVGTETVAIRYLNVQAYTEIPVAIPCYTNTEFVVLYGIDVIEAIQNTDYTYEMLGAGNFFTFKITPTPSLIAKIDALIALDPDEVNAITVRRVLDYKTSASAPFASDTKWVSREFDRTAMRLQQLDEKVNRSIVLSPAFVGDSETPALQLNELEPGRTLQVNSEGTAIVGGPTSSEIEGAQAFAEAALAAAVEALANANAAAANANSNYVFDSVALLNAANVPVPIERIFVGTGYGYHERIRIAAPGVVMPWHTQSADGAWWEINLQQGVCAEMYNALGGTSNDVIAIQNAMDAAALSKAVMRISQPLRAGGELSFDDGLEMHWSNEAWTRQTGFSTSGSFFENLRPSSSAVASIMANITLVNPYIDGSLFPAPVELEVVSSTGTTVTFNPAASGTSAAASDVDDFYVGLCLEDTRGLNGGGLRIVTDYVGATRTATHTTAWDANPTIGTKILTGWNDNAIGVAAGVTNLSILRGVLKNYPANKMVPSGTGGKGGNFEQGVTNGRMIGVHFEDVGTGPFVQGVDGTYANGAKKRATPIQISGCSCKRVGSALTIAGINSAQGPDGDSDDSMVLVTDHTWEDAGHSPFRIVSSDPQKSGIINFLEAQNVSIFNARGRNNSTYPNVSPGYPTDYSARCGFAGAALPGPVATMAGNVGAFFWGHGRNLTVNGAEHSGNVDNVFVVRRGRALGDDAGPDGKVRNCFNWRFKNIKLIGVINEYVIRIDPTALLRVDPAELTGEIEVYVNGGFITGGLIDPNMSAFSSITMTIHDYVGGKTVIGTPAQILAEANQFSLYPSGVTDLRVKTLKNANLQGQKFTLLDNTAIGITPPKSFGILAITSATSFLCLQIAFRTTGGVQCVVIGTLPSNVAIDITTGSLLGTTGADNFFTIRCNQTDGKIYLENQRGGTVDFFATFIG